MEVIGNAVAQSWDHSVRERDLQASAYIPDRSVLTPREVEVLCLLADGLSTKAVAAELNVAFKTAACHRYRILQKLGANSTVTAVRWAIREGIIVP